MALALKTRNMDQLFKYVNIKAIANNLAESALPNSDDDKGGPEAPWDRKTQEMGRPFGPISVVQPVRRPGKADPPDNGEISAKSG